jgi:hypothetical protein
VQMIITVERPSNATTDSFRENDIIDWLTTIMGMLTTRRISISALVFSYWAISHTENIAYDVEEANDNVTRDTSLMLPGISATLGCNK